MANYAYKDAAKKEGVCANDVLTDDRNKVFYCPHPSCGAHLYICAVEGSRKAYFRATKSEFPHEPNCPYSSNNDKFNADQFDETHFIFDDAIRNLCVMTAVPKARKTSGEHSEGEVKAHPPRTIRQIYSMCKSFPESRIYGDKEIGKMLLDDRSVQRYPKGCFGYKIIEATIQKKIYNNKERQIYLTAPLGSKKYSFVLQFSDYNTYQTIRDEIYKNQDKIIVVAGKWERAKEYNCFIAKINGRKQVAIIKRQNK